MRGNGPRLRAVDAVFVDDPARGRVLVLRDTEGIAESSVVVPARLAPAVARLDGTRSAATIATEVAGAGLDASTVAELIAALDRAHFLETPRFERKKREVMQAFASDPVRRATHAGGAYHGEPEALTRYIDDACLAHAPKQPPRGRLVGLCAPHMDLWRAARGYGHAYGALRDAITPEVDTFVLLGTCHAPMTLPFAVCDKPFETPLGRLAPDTEAIADLTRAARFDVRADAYLHKGEHSIEFQAVFLRHLVGDRDVRILPILCGLGEAQATRRDPDTLPDAASFLDGLASLVERRNGRAMIVAGADLAHMGPRFGDAAPLDEHERGKLHAKDRESIALATKRDARGFFEQVTADLGTRRVCGVGPIYTMLRAMGAGTGDALHYAQHVDAEDGSIVSHASMGFYA